MLTYSMHSQFSLSGTHLLLILTLFFNIHVKVALNMISALIILNLYVIT